MERVSNEKNTNKTTKYNKYLTIYEYNKKYTELVEENNRLDIEIEVMKSKGTNTDLTPEMNSLHRYNETKDITQVVLGHLATIEGVTIKKLHERYNLPLN